MDECRPTGPVHGASKEEGTTPTGCKARAQSWGPGSISCSARLWQGLKTFDSSANPHPEQEPAWLPEDGLRTRMADLRTCKRQGFWGLKHMPERNRDTVGAHDRLRLVSHDGGGARRQQNTGLISASVLPTEEVVRGVAACLRPSGPRHRHRLRQSGLIRPHETASQSLAADRPRWPSRCTSHSPLSKQGSELGTLPKCLGPAEVSWPCRSVLAHAGQAARC